jgi:glycosyltransferase involved in cell wall biosynthesis
LGLKSKESGPADAKQASATQALRIRTPANCKLAVAPTGAKVLTQDILKVSVAMCTFNGERFVGAQLESILNQTRPPDEIIICDDASKDATVDLMRKIAAKSDTRVHIIENKENLGYLENFESAIKRTTGDVIFLSDQDDVWFPDKVATMIVPFSQNPDVVLTYSDALLTDAELRPSGATVFGRRKGMQLQKTPTVRQLGRAVGFNGPAVAFHSRLKPFVIPLSPLSNQWGHDHWIGFIAYAVGDTRVVDRPLLYYRRHGKNVGGDAELDGGLRHQWQVIKKLRVGTKAYVERRRGWEDMVARLSEIKDHKFPGVRPKKLDELLEEAESCLNFAIIRESLKRKRRSARLILALCSFVLGDYHRHARGIKSLIQDVIIP